MKNRLAVYIKLWQKYGVDIEMATHIFLTNKYVEKCKLRPHQDSKINKKLICVAFSKIHPNAKRFWRTLQAKQMSFSDGRKKVMLGRIFAQHVAQLMGLK